MTVKAILTDIEGTTTDISFVHDVLFPYARQQLPCFVQQHWHEPAIRDVMALAKEELGMADADQPTLIKAFLNWIDQDKKVTALKTLQGLIWVEGYKNADFSGHLYKDAYDYLKKWHAEGIELNVFSSGSVKAQQLLFGHSDFGDLTPLFTHYFDTTTGHKREQTAYQAIAKVMQQSPEHILFLSDIEEELDAAKSAGMQTCLLVRDRMPDGSNHSSNHSSPHSSQHEVVSTFAEISV
ncbi:acireductone synthase [Neptunomonas antarctica]|uniref:Enolase-phosphatase E1 n=1 Tax=Neptunomonas antarctica TaxID=619304 RepID=A0A1N7P4J9_9GAMM|nr:acireductone synthase [Neptunomonas antarctica]SIT05460.1 acireductone synthase [Neptunomonas antarctica]